MVFSSVLSQVLRIAALVRRTGVRKGQRMCHA
jgi:hypothetical protein